MFHVWVSTGEPELDSCLVCGGVWEYYATDSVTGDHMAANGDGPAPCTGDTDSCHHYTDECGRTPFGDECRIDPDCNCLYCA